MPEFHQSGAGISYFRNKDIGEIEAKCQSKEFLQELEIEVCDFDGDLLLSTEYFFDTSASQVQKLDAYFSKIGFELHIVYYVRHPIALSTSSINQWVKMGAGSLSKLLVDPYWPKLTNLRPFLNALGKDRIIVRPFAASKSFAAEIDILTAIGYSGSLTEIDRKRANTSLSMKAVFMADLHQKLLGEKGYRSSSRGYLTKIGGPKFVLPPDTIDIIRHKAIPELLWLKEEFGIVLEEPTIDADSSGRTMEEMKIFSERALRDVISGLNRDESKVTPAASKAKSQLKSWIKRRF